MSADLRHFIRVYDDDLDSALCQRLLASFNALQRFHRTNGRQVRAGLEDSEWTELNVSKFSDDGFRSMFRERIDQALARYNRDVSLPIPVPNSTLNSDLVMKRYHRGGRQRFQLHFDSIDHVANRYLVLLWYLNDVTVGGETGFAGLDLGIAPKAGRLLMFPPYWMYQHEGRVPVTEDKYILSTYLLFRTVQTS